MNDSDESEIDKIRYVAQCVSDVFDRLFLFSDIGMTDAQLFRTFTTECLSAGVDTVSYLVGGAGQHGYDDIISPPSGRHLQDGDVLIFDTPPNYESNAFKAVMASDYVIIPSSNNFLEQDNTKNAVSLPTLSGKPFKILMSKVKKGTKEGREMLEKVISKDISFDAVITERNVVAQSPRYGAWVGEYAKNSDSHKQFIALAKEVEVWANLAKVSTKVDCSAVSEGVA